MSIYKCKTFKSFTKFYIFEVNVSAAAHPVQDVRIKAFTESFITFAFEYQLQLLSAMVIGRASSKMTMQITDNL